MIMSILATRLPNRVEGELPGAFVDFSIGGFLLSGLPAKTHWKWYYAALGMPEAFNSGTEIISPTNYFI